MTEEGLQSPNSNTTRRLHIFYGLTIMILVFALVLTNFFNITGFAHTRKLNKFKENLTSYKMPPNTYSIGSYAEIGNIYSNNGDSCDYIAGELYETDLTKEDINKYYANVTFPNVDGNEQIKINILFKEEKSERGRLIYEI